MSDLLIENNAFVQKGDKLAVISNEIDYQDFLKFKNFILKFHTSLLSNDKIYFPETLRIGDFQNQLSELKILYKNFNKYDSLKPEQKEIKKIFNQINHHKRLHENLENQRNLFKENLDITKKDYVRKEDLLKDGLISETDIEQAKIEFLDKQRNFQNIQSIKFKTLLLSQILNGNTNN